LADHPLPRRRDVGSLEGRRQPAAVLSRPARLDALGRRVADRPAFPLSCVRLLDPHGSLWLRPPASPRLVRWFADGERAGGVGRRSGRRVGSRQSVASRLQPDRSGLCSGNLLGRVQFLAPAPRSLPQGNRARGMVAGIRSDGGGVRLHALLRRLHAGGPRSPRLWGDSLRLRSEPCRWIAHGSGGGIGGHRDPGMLRSVALHVASADSESVPEAPLPLYSGGEGLG
jgi:hypothetical protein